MTGTWPTGWATGDIVPATEYAKSVGSIYDTTLGGSAASIDITSIPAVYAHLLVVAYLRSTAAATNDTVIIRANGDSGANYNSGASAGTTGVLNIIPAATAQGSNFAACQFLLPFYAGTANWKPMFTEAAISDSVYGSSGAGVAPGVWKSASAINRLTFSCTTGSLAAGCRLTLYAMGA